MSSGPSLAFVSVRGAPPPHRAQRSKTLEARLGFLSDASRKASLDSAAWDSKTDRAYFFVWLCWEYLLRADLRRVETHYSTLPSGAERDAFAIVNADALALLTRTLATRLSDPSAASFFSRATSEFKFLECARWTLLPAAY